MASSLRDPRRRRGFPSRAVAPGDPCVSTGGGPLYFFNSLLVLSLTLCMALPIAAQDGSEEPSSTEGALFLLLPVGAKAVSLGRAVTALDGPESAFWNPAGLAAVDESQVVLLRGDPLAGTSTAFSALWARPGVGTLGVSYQLLDIGTQELRDIDGNELGSISVRNHLGVVSAAAQLLEGVRLGVNFKIVQFRRSCRGICSDAGTTATTYAFDAGLQILPTERLRIGAMLAHIGPRLQVLNADQSDPLPARVRLAFAYNLIALLTDDEELGGWLAVEVQDRLRELGSLSFYLGTELTAGVSEAIFLRAGYVLGNLDQEDGARVGLGFRFGRFDLAIAKSLAVSTLTGETEPVHVTFSIRF